MTIKKLELVAAAITLVTFTLALIVLPAISIFYVAGLGTLAMLYAIGATNIFGTLNKPAEDAVAELKEAGSAGRIIPFFHLLFAMPCVGLLFKLQTWPNADSFLYLAIGILLAATLWVVSNYIKTGYFNPSLVKRIAIYAGCCLILLSLPAYGILDIKYRNHPAYLNALKYSIEHPGQRAAQDKLNQERQKMDDGK